MNELIDAQDCMPVTAKNVDFAQYGIGLVGCGGIANVAHIPAYLKAGFRIAACCDVNAEAARTTAEKFGIPFWTTDIRELVNRDDVKVIDLAIHPHARLSVLQEIAKNPKPVVCQKPFHMDLASARQLADVAKSAGIVMTINQQARWASQYKAVRKLLDDGHIGQVYSIANMVRGNQDDPNYWWYKVPNFTIIDHGIHYLDLTRYFNASPYAGQQEWQRLQCTTAKLPDQNAVSPMIYSVNIEFGQAGGTAPLMANLHFNNIVRVGWFDMTGRTDGNTWWIDGSEGSVWVQNDRVYLAKVNEPSTIHEIKIRGTANPDYFAGPMGDLIAAVDQGRNPSITPEDNLLSLSLAEAMVKSSEQGRVIERSEIVTWENATAKAAV